jgi:hypothetical protein
VFAIWVQPSAANRTADTALTDAPSVSDTWVFCRFTVPGMAAFIARQIDP